FISVPNEQASGCGVLGGCGGVHPKSVAEILREAHVGIEAPKVRPHPNGCDASFSPHWFGRPNCLERPFCEGSVPPLGVWSGCAGRGLARRSVINGPSQVVPLAARSA